MSWWNPFSKSMGMNKGGGIPDLNDPSNKDTVPAMLTVGEFVLNKEASQMFRPQIEAMNKAGLKQRVMENNMVKRNIGGPLSGMMGYADGTETFDDMTREEFLQEWNEYLTDEGDRQQALYDWSEMLTDPNTPQWAKEFIVGEMYARDMVAGHPNPDVVTAIHSIYRDMGGNPAQDQSNKTVQERMRDDFAALMAAHEARGGKVFEDGTIPLSVRTELDRKYGSVAANDFLYRVIDQSGMIQKEREGPNAGTQAFISGYQAGQAPTPDEHHSIPEVDAILRGKILSPQEKVDRLLQLVDQGVIPAWRAKDIVRYRMGIDGREPGALTLQQRKALGIDQPVAEDTRGVRYEDRLNQPVQTPSNTAYQYTATQGAPAQGRLTAILNSKFTSPEQKADAIVQGMNEGSIGQAEGSAALQQLGVFGGTGVQPGQGTEPPVPYYTDRGTPPQPTSGYDSATVQEGTAATQDAYEAEAFGVPPVAETPPERTGIYANIPEDWFVNNNPNPNEDGNYQFANVKFTSAPYKPGRKLEDPETGEEYRKGQRLVDQLTGKHWIYGG